MLKNCVYLNLWNSHSKVLFYLSHTFIFFKNEINIVYNGIITFVLSCLNFFLQEMFDICIDSDLITIQKCTISE